MNRLFFLILILICSCGPVKRSQDKVVPLRFTSPFSIEVYDEQLIIYLPKDEVMEYFKHREKHTADEKMILDYISNLNDNTLKIIKPENNLKINDDFQSGIFNCLANFLAVGLVSIYNKKDSCFESSIRVKNINSIYAGKQRQYFLKGTLFLTDVIALGE